MSEHLIFDLDELRERSDEVNPLDATAAITAIKAKLNKYKDLYCLSAPQVGIKERVIGIKFNDGKIMFYINPRILKSEGLHLVREKDISIAEKEFISPRPTKILVSYQTEDARPEENILNGVLAETFDRMQNYLDGITPEDIGLEIIEGFDEASEEEKQQVIDMYLDSLRRRNELINENIQQDKDARELKEAIEFMEAVDTGKVTLGDRSLLINHEDNN